jgi:exodeoxyribonuclease VII small subunit
MTVKLNYVEAFQELQEIVTEIEQGEISVDKLSEKVKRASELIKICKLKLTNTEEDVNKILKELDTTALGTNDDSQREENNDAGLPF